MDEAKLLKKGQRVEVANKNVRGKIAYIGMTSFAVGKWVGVILDEPKGKNNGTIKGNTYFSCPENHGMFVRPTQLIYLDDSDNPIEDVLASEEKPRSRLSSSRQSLIGSRQNLIGSRSQLASPGDFLETSVQSTSSSSVVEPREKLDIVKPTKTSMSPPAPGNGQGNKRASFIETGFLETLKPQFTPGQSLTSPLVSSEEKALLLQCQQENEDLKSKNTDLQEKLETLKMRRAEDKEKLREFDKMKTQFEQLQEFKSKIMDAQSHLQKELQRAKQEAKDAIDARDRHAEEMADLSENVEMITLDKEMAEEKADTLQIELENAKERIEELILDLEIMKNEMQNKTLSGEVTSSGTGSEISTYEFKQLEQQNVRLRETLVRMRDLSAHEKHEAQKMQKELETKKSEVLELQRIKEKLSSRIDELETQVADLQEQVDAALGAEEMVEQLAEKKMELEDRVKSLEEEVAELEALEEVHEQLVESNHELELDLREELDMAHSVKREAIREKDALLETVLDRDQTIIKFRELVQRLNEQSQELRDKVSKDSNNTSTEQITETIDFKQVFAESKAHTRAIDLQLRQIELIQSNEHVKYLLAYMPEIFMVRGSDHDAISVILLVSRIVFKADIIITQARERFPIASVIDRTAILQGHEVYQFAFRSRLLHHLHNLQMVMHQFLFGLSVCSPDVLLKIGSSLPEMIAQEKIVDNIVELFKHNQVDENTTTDSLEKCVSFFNALFSVLLAVEGHMNEIQMVRDSVASINAACDSIETDGIVIRGLIQGGDETSESGLLIQFLIQNVETIRQQLKLIKRRLPQDNSITKCNLSSEMLSNLKHTVESLSKLMNLMSLASKCITQFVISDAANESSTGANNNTISHKKLWEILNTVSEKVYDQDDLGISPNIHNILNNVKLDTSKFAQFLLDHEYEVMSGTQVNKQKPMPPIFMRAQIVKKQLEETKTLTATLENREAEIRQLKLNSKLKQNELSEMQIRKDLAEKKLSVLQQDHESNFTKLQREYDEVVARLKKKEKEFEETMDHLQSDIDSLENERGALREKLKVYTNKKGDLKTTTALDINASSPYIAQELDILKKALHHERDERMRVQASELHKSLKNLQQLHVPKFKDNKIDNLEKELHKVKHDWLISIVKGAEIPASNTKHSNWNKLLHDQQNTQQKLRNEIKNKVENLANNIFNEYLERKPYRSAYGDFVKFSSNELSQAFKGTVKN